MTALVAGLLMLALFLGPLVLRVAMDRRADRAEAVAADLRAAVRRRLGGESMVALDVAPGGRWSRGRVMLSAPTGYERLVEQVWPVVAKGVPVGYELVIRTWAGPADVVASAAPLTRAA